MEAMRIPANRRTETGKGVARGLRRSGKIPAVVYGKGTNPVGLAISPKDLLGVLGSAFGRNTVLELDMERSDMEGRETVTVLLADFQYHPVSRNLLHADFLRIRLDEPVSVEVPFKLVGKAKGTTLGGILRQVFLKLPVSCLPTQIPVCIEYDVTDMALDAHVSVAALSLPEGVVVQLPPNQTVCAVVTEKRTASAEDEAAEKGQAAAEGGGDAAPSAATPS